MGYLHRIPLNKYKKYTPMRAPFTFLNNIEKSRFELHLAQVIGKAEYIAKGKTIIIYKTEIPEALSDLENGVSTFINEIINYCRLNGLELQIQCPFTNAVASSLEVWKN